MCLFFLRLPFQWNIFLISFPFKDYEMLRKKWVEFLTFVVFRISTLKTKNYSTIVNKFFIHVWRQLNSKHLWVFTFIKMIIFLELFFFVDFLLHFYFLYTKYVTKRSPLYITMNIWLWVLVSFSYTTYFTKSQKIWL